MLKASLCIYNIYNSTRSDWLWAYYFFHYFQSDLFYRDGSWRMFLSLRHDKNVIYSKLLNNPFNEIKDLYKILLWISIFFCSDAFFLYFKRLKYRSIGRSLIFYAHSPVLIKKVLVQSHQPRASNNYPQLLLSTLH